MKTILIAFALCFVFLHGRSQNTFNLPTVIPPAPDAAALGKYGNTPVEMHTGIPNIGIPLYTIRTKSFELPLSLNYHASGFRVADIAPWTGLGWTLSAGGAISRSAIGLGDDNGSGYLNNQDIQSANDIDGNDLDYLLAVCNETLDNESDIYFYNFGGRSGKFVLDDEKKPFLIPTSPLRVKYFTNRFEITTEDGTLYNFATRESLTAGVYTPLGQEFHSYTSTYHLTQITSADGTDIINFNYGADAPYTINSTSYAEIIGDKCGLDPSGSVWVVQKQRDFSTSFSYRTVNPLYVSSITFASGKIDFVRVADRVDGGSSRLSEIQVKRKVSEGVYSSVKTFKFNTSYFSTNPASKRLKLNDLSEHDALDNFIKKHEFFYSETLLPPRDSFAQDWWGYYNGKNSSSTSLIPTENINFQGHVYSVGNANRAPDENFMQACILKKIKYPTGGYTEFDYEAHYFEGAAAINRSVNANAGTWGNTTDLLEQTVQFTTTDGGWAKVSTHCSNVTDATPFFSTVTLTRLEGNQSLVNHVYDPYNFPPFGPELNKDYLVYIYPGYTYQLKVQSKGNTQSSYYGGAAFSKATVYWEEYIQGSPQMAGGLRIKEIRDFEGAGSIAITKIFKYGQNENSKGLILTPANKLSSFKEVKPTKFWFQPSNGLCFSSCQTDKQHIYGIPPQDLTTFNGATVVYPEVTVYEKATSAPNGKTVYRFNVATDEIYPAASGYRDGVILVNNDWKGGQKVWSAAYSPTSKVQETSQVHSILQPKEISATKIGRKVLNEGPCGPVYSSLSYSDFFYFFDYPIKSGINKLMSQTEISYNSADPTKFVQWQETYEYPNLTAQHQQLSSKTTTGSDGQTTVTKYWYPADYGAVGNINTLLTKNIIAVPIKQEVHKNSKIIAGSVNLPNADGKPYEIHQYESATSQTPPAHSGTTLVPAGYNKKATITYDGTTKNINQVALTDNITKAYLWGYNNEQPVAEITNATTSVVAYTSFESNGKGNWNYNGAAYNDILAKTGKFYYKLGGGNVTKSLAAGKYRLQYWAKGTVNLSGGTITAVYASPADANGWIFYEKQVVMTATTTLTLSGTSTAFVDELRVFPATSLMKSFTYDPVIGVTTTTDTNGLITYYEYDNSGRLKLIRDNNRNILKTYTYNYKN